MSTDPMTPIQKLWLAGLGMAATFGDNATRIFDDLVARGEQVDPSAARQTMEKMVGQAGDAMESLAAEVQTQIRQAGERLRAQAPTREEFDALSKRVADLEARLGGTSAAPEEVSNS